MRKDLFLSKQAYIIPVLAIVNITLGLFVSGYDVTSQRISELALETPFIAYTHRIADIIIGISMCIFALQAFSVVKGYFSLLTILAFGLTWIFAGVFILTSPLHDIYGLTTVLIIIPLIFVIEYREVLKSNYFQTYSIITSLIHIIFFWFFNYGFFSQDNVGITQRVWVFITLIWFGVAAKNIMLAKK
ncbi:DUF998 domain-containing protein [Flavobacteriaceae bacterium R38]|nr:DUF998 domain-containing protein [Flavobacteriaceae bacterium R38]